MNANWKMLSYKQRTALTQAVKSNNGKISLNYLRRNIYQEDKRARKAMEKLKNQGFIEKIGIGNNFKIEESNIPQGEL